MHILQGGTPWIKLQWINGENNSCSNTSAVCALLRPMFATSGLFHQGTFEHNDIRKPHAEKEDEKAPETKAMLTY